MAFRCPVCSNQFDSDTLEFHVNSCLDGFSPSRTGASSSCRKCDFEGCGQTIVQRDWASHALAHRLALQSPAPACGAPGSEVFDLTSDGDSPAGQAASAAAQSRGGGHMPATKRQGLAPWEAAAGEDADLALARRLDAEERAGAAAASAAYAERLRLLDTERAHPPGPHGARADPRDLVVDVDVGDGVRRAPLRCAAGGDPLEAASRWLRENSLPAHLCGEVADFVSRAAGGGGGAAGGAGGWEGGDLGVAVDEAQLRAQQTAEKVLSEAPEGLINLLRDALLAQPASHGLYRVALCGAPLRHFATRKEDSGWGCGWRNIQSLADHLIRRRAPEGNPGGNPEQGAGEVGSVDRGNRLGTALFGGAGFVPEILSLQAWLEAAWGRGFDPVGRAQLGGTVVGTRKWIGAAECCSLLRSFGARARLVDFRSTKAAPAAGLGVGKERKRAAEGAADRYGGGEKASKGNFDGERDSRQGRLQIASGSLAIVPGESSGSRDPPRPQAGGTAAGPAAAAAAGGRQGGAGQTGQARESSLNKGADEEHTELVEWVWRYFTTDRAGRPLPPVLGRQCVMSEKPPLYWQHQGHSRTLVGVERRRRSPGAKEETNLLVLDPSDSAGAVAAALRRRDGWQRMLKRGVHTLVRREYQVVVVEEGIAEGQELVRMRQLEYNHEQRW